MGQFAPRANKTYSIVNDPLDGHEYSKRRHFDKSNGRVQDELEDSVVSLRSSWNLTSDVVLRLPTAETGQLL